MSPGMSICVALFIWTPLSAMTFLGGSGLGGSGLGGSGAGGGGGGASAVVLAGGGGAAGGGGGCSPPTFACVSTWQPLTPVPATPTTAMASTGSNALSIFMIALWCPTRAEARWKRVSLGRRKRRSCPSPSAEEK